DGARSGRECGCRRAAAAGVEALAPAAHAGSPLGAGADVKPAPFDYHRPATLDQALAILAENEDAKPLAGGQSLVPMLNFRLRRPSALVDLGAIEELGGDPGDDGTLALRARTRRGGPSSP